MSSRLDRGRVEVEVLVRSARAERLKANLPRYLFIGLIGILCLAGLKTILSPAQASSEDEEIVGLVDQAAEGLALRFTRSYLTYDADRPGPRQRALASMLPGDVDSDAGLVPRSGTQRVEWVEIAQHQEALTGGVVIVVAAQISGAPTITYLAVPIVRRSGGSLAIDGYPSLVGPPTVSTASRESRQEVGDEAITDTVGRVLTNYLRGESDDLTPDLAAAATFSLPAQSLRVLSVDDVVWASDPETPAVLATVSATDAERARWTLTYEVGVDTSSGRTLITYIETVPNAT